MPRLASRRSQAARRGNTVPDPAVRGAARRENRASRTGRGALLALLPLAGLLGVAGPAAASPDALGPDSPVALRSEVSAALVVSPAERLFDVTLHPGDSVVAPATLVNRSAAELRVRLTPIEASASHGAFSALSLATARLPECSVAAMAATPGTPFPAAQALDQGLLDPGEALELCVRVDYDAPRALDAPDTARVDLAFSASEAAAPRDPDPALPLTGADTLLGGILLGGALAGLGATLIAHRRHSARSAH